MTDDGTRRQVGSGLPDEAPPSASRSADRADLRIDPELQRWLDDAQAPRRPQRYNLFIVVEALPYIAVMIGVLAFALLAGWALQNLP
jgi:antibiotic biosynthesis monooxygenase (ABM) superfamily enzyme